MKSVVASPLCLKNIPKISLTGEEFLQWNILILKLFYNFNFLLLSLMADKRINTSFCCIHYYSGIFFNDYTYLLLALNFATYDYFLDL